ncbi:MAG: ABC transporter ATP-binding protein [bacterium]
MGIISIVGLTKSYRSGFWGKRKRALEGLNLEVEKGETFGYLGPNGAGKTTTLKILLGLIQPDSGHATILDQSISTIKVRSRIGFLPEQPYFYDYLTGRELLEFYGHFFGLSRLQRMRRIADLLEMVSLTGAENLALRKYSKGMLQRIGIAQALINDPDIIFLDEPLSGLDPIGRKEVKDIVHTLKKEGKTIFFCSHILPDVEMICDRIGILDKGRLIAVGSLDDLLHVEAKGIDIEFTGVSGQGLVNIRRAAKKSLEQNHRVQVTLDGDDRVMDVIRMIDESGGRVLSVIPHRMSLEEIFVNKLDLRREKFQ